MRILLVDDDPSVLHAFARALRGCGHTTMIAHNSAAALTAAQAFTPDAVISEVELGCEAGPELIRAIRASAPHVSCVLMTGNVYYEPTADLAQVPVVYKPCGARALLDALRSNMFIT